MELALLYKMLYINVKNSATGSKVKATLEDAVNVGVSVLGNTVQNKILRL